MSDSYFASALPQYEVAELQRLMLEEIREVAVFFMNPDGIITVWNKAAEDMKGYTAEDVIGQHLRLLYTNEDKARGRPEHNLNEAVKNGCYRKETWRRKKDGSLFRAKITLTALHNDDGVLVGFSKATLDLTEHKLLERCLKEKEETNPILRPARAGTWKWNIADDKIEVSPQFLALLGYTSGDTQSGREWTFDEWLEALHPDDRSSVARQFHAARDQCPNAQLAMQMRISGKDGGYHWYYVRADWYREKESDPFLLMGVNVDIHDLKTAKQERVRLFRQLQAERIALCRDTGPDALRRDSRRGSVRKNKLSEPCSGKNAGAFD
jgi:PAS domain S-box-containing protein